MTLDSLIAIAGLLVAAYQIMPKSRQLELKFKIRIIDWCIVSIAFLSILYLQFYSFFISIGLSPHLGLMKWKITPERMSFVVLLMTSLILAISFRFTRLSSGKIFKLTQLIDELKWSKKYSELFTLLERNLNQILIIDKNRSIISRIRSHLLNPKYQNNSIKQYSIFKQILENIDSPKIHSENQLKVNGFIASIKNNKLIQLFRDKILFLKGRLYRFLAHLLPNNQDKSQAAGDLLRRTLNSPEIASAIVINKPYFGLCLLKIDFREVQEFSVNYIHALMMDKSSILYSEIRNNQNLGEYNFYFIPPNNKVLHYLFENSRVAEKLGIWKPIGDTILTELNRLARNPGDDPYHLGMDDDFQENGQWESPLFIGVFLFKLMVPRALLQGVTWHMWLYYFQFIVQRISRNYSHEDPSIDSNAEFPTRYSYLLYKIFDALRDWILAIKHVPKTQKNVVLESISVEHQNDNIPKSSIIALGLCLRYLVASEKIERHFKHDMLHLAFDLYFDLKRISPDYAKVLMLVLKPDGFHYRKDKGEYRDELIQAFQTFDQIPHLNYIKAFQGDLFQ